MINYKSHHHCSMQVSHVYFLLNSSLYCISLLVFFLIISQIRNQAAVPPKMTPRKINPTLPWNKSAIILIQGLQCNFKRTITIHNKNASKNENSESNLSRCLSEGYYGVYQGVIKGLSRSYHGSITGLLRQNFLQKIK